MSHYFTATYDPLDNKLRLYASSRLDEETYQRVKSAGFRWAAKQDLFVAPMWTPEREDLLIELAGEIGDEDTSLVERAEERADRFDGYRENRIKDAQAAQEAVDYIADGRNGTPIIRGHHSYKRAMKDQERIENGMAKTVQMWKTASYWERRAAGALRHAEYKERPDVRHRRIKGIEADLRKVEKSKAESEKWLRMWTAAANIDDPAEQLTRARFIANHCNLYLPRKEGDREDFSGNPNAYDVFRDEPSSLFVPRTIEDVFAAAQEAYPKAIERAERWIEHYTFRIAYEKAMLGESGGIAADKFDFAKGGKVLARHNEWLVILKINKKDGAVCSVTTTPPRFWGGRKYVAPIEEIREYRAPSAEDTAVVEAATKIAPMCNYPGDGFATCTQAEWKAIHADYKGSDTIAATDTTGRHRVRRAHGVYLHRPEPKAPQSDTDRENYRHHYFSVFITDAKRVDPPAKTPATEPAPTLADVTVPHPTPRVVSTPPRVRDERIPSYEDLNALKTAAQNVKVVVVPDLFPTPAWLAERMVQLAEIQPGDRVLEPSAGTGAILEAIPAEHHDNVTAVEINAVAADALHHRFPLSIPLPPGERSWTAPVSGMTIRRDDFLSLNGELGTFDVILANPPFGQGADIKHITHALSKLKPGGRLVALCANGPRQEKALKPIVDAHGGTWEELPADTFKDAGTSARSVLMTLTK